MNLAICDDDPSQDAKWLQFVKNLSTFDNMTFFQQQQQQMCWTTNAHFQAGLHDASAVY